jgi:hypothetical protein
MGLQSVAGVFSRYFVIGFFLPAFFAVLILAHVIASSWLPHVYNDAPPGGQVLVAGGAALFIALLLQALNVAIVRGLEGYPVKSFASATGVGSRLKKRIHDRLMRPIEQRYDQLVQLREADVESPERTEAARKLDYEYPYPRRQSLLPTRIGNVIRAFEVHPRRCYGLDGVLIWPRIQLLLSDGERVVVEDSQTNFSFLVNAAVVLVLLGIVLIADAVAHGPLPWTWFVVWIPYTLPFVTAWVALILTIPAAQNWGESVKAAIDLHRLDLYHHLGVRRPGDPKDEVDTVARAVNRLLLYGEPLVAELRIEEDNADGAKAAPQAETTEAPGS